MILGDKISSGLQLFVGIQCKLKIKLIKLTKINIALLILAVYVGAAIFQDTSQVVLNGFILINGEFLIFIYVIMELVQNAIFFVMFSTMATMLHTCLVLDGIKSI